MIHSNIKTGARLHWGNLQLVSGHPDIYRAVLVIQLSPKNDRCQLWKATKKKMILLVVSLFLISPFLILMSCLPMYYSRRRRLWVFWRIASHCIALELLARMGEDEEERTLHLIALYQLHWTSCIIPVALDQPAICLPPGGDQSIASDSNCALGWETTWRRTLHFVILHFCISLHYTGCCYGALHRTWTACSSGRGGEGGHLIASVIALYQFTYCWLLRGGGRCIESWIYLHCIETQLVTRRGGGGGEHRIRPSLASHCVWLHCTNVWQVETLAAYSFGLFPLCVFFIGFLRLNFIVIEDCQKKAEAGCYKAKSGAVESSQPVYSLGLSPQCTLFMCFLRLPT